MLTMDGLRLIPDGRRLEIRKLNGWKLKQKAKRVFRTDSVCHWKKNFSGIATPRTFFNVFELKSNATLLEVFSTMPGEWRKKCCSVNQVIEFCATYPEFLSQEWGQTFFLAKKNERHRKQVIDTENPEKNLYVFCVTASGKAIILEERILDKTYTLYGITGHRFVVPKRRRLNPGV
ncbi:hypothetical protein GX917_00500 [Candidatus Falkowbacteria bacterium]|jgi:hypothetical protein|nr:hypothetical protein [Candidatus Falkowbacteria bacterium]